MPPESSLSTSVASTSLEARNAELEARNSVLEAELRQTKAKLAESETAHARARAAYMRALEQLQLLRRRLFLAKAERCDAASEQLAFDAMFDEVKALEAKLQATEDAEEKKRKKDKRAATPRGRRDLAESDLPVVRVELTCPELEGVAERIGVEESSRLGYERGGFRRIVVARVVYKSAPGDASGAPEIVTAPLPKELFKRSLLAPSTVAHVLASKYLLGVPFYRLEQQLALSGARLDRGTMCRYAEDAGATLGAIVLAMRDDAMASAFCLSTDATGVAIQPGPMKDRPTESRQACRKGHFFVVLADRDHVFFEYQAKHTSAAVCAMFEGYSGYIQADAHAVYDALFRGAPLGQAAASHVPPPTEVGCWAHARRNFWEAAVCKYDIGREGLRRINTIFEADRLLGDMPPGQRKIARDAHVRPLVDAFFTWVLTLSEAPRERGLVASALGYAKNQREPLGRFLDDGRLRMDNNPSERALRAIAAARKSWMFFGSDDHASAAANLFSLVASCKLHGIDPEAYFADVLRVMPYWPRQRYLELSPRDWHQTRARLDARELAAPLGHVTVPEALAAKEKSASE